MVRGKRGYVNEMEERKLRKVGGQTNKRRQRKKKGMGITRKRSGKNGGRKNK